MRTEELIEELKAQEEKDIVLNLQGIIITTILIKKLEVIKEENKLILQNQENKEEYMGFNVSQLMKITKISENKIFLEFDQLQNIEITIISKRKEAINQTQKIATNFSNC